MVTYNGSAADAIPIHVVKSSFGMLTTSGAGAGNTVIRHSDNQLLTFAAPAHTGEMVTLWGTGLGPVEGAEAAGPLAGNVFTPEVFAGNRAATVRYAGRSHCCAGLDEITFDVPADVQGCFVPVVVRMGSVVSNFGSLPIAPAGEACSDPVGLSPDLLTKGASGTGLNVGGIALGPVPVLENAGFNFPGGLANRFSSLLGVKVSEQEVLTMFRGHRTRRSRAFRALMKKYAPILKARNLDPETIIRMTDALNNPGVAAAFLRGTMPAGLAGQFAAILPPPGTCTAGVPESYNSAISSAGADGNDAGPQLFFTGPAGAQTLDQTSNGTYQLLVETDSSHLALPSGTYFVTSNGGADVGPFSASIQIGSPLTWTNKASVGFIDRSEPLTIQWSGGPPSGYVVFGGQGSTKDGVRAAFACVADVRDQMLKVPDYILGVIPHTSNGFVSLTTHPMQNVFSAPGLDIGYFADARTDSKTIGFQ